jgi:hypothetical protein
MAVGFKKCRRYFDMLDSNGDRCVGSSLPWAGKQQPKRACSAHACGALRLARQHQARLKSACLSSAQHESSAALPCRRQ